MKKFDTKIKKTHLFKLRSYRGWLEISFFFLFTFTGSAQNDCALISSQAQSYVDGAGVPVDYKQALSMIQPCADQGEENALNLLGIMYCEGYGVEKNETKGFDFIMKSAMKDNVNAQYNLGRFYTTGKGCDIDYDKAIYWFTKAADNGFERAAYALGYMYYKGFGVPQDYKKAVSWFELSSYHMAKHWLGVCYYFGYGVSQNEDKAIENFAKSKTANSQMFLNYIITDVKQNIETRIASATSERETETNAAIDKEVIIETADKVKNTPIKNQKEKKINLKHLSGKWVGKMVELDWSGTHVVRVTPISLDIKSEKDVINYVWEVNKTKNEDFAIWVDNTMYFDKLYMRFDEPYSPNPASNTLDWQFLSAQLKFKNVNNKNYLTANLQSFIDEYKEPGPPMYLILKRMGKQEDVQDMTDQEIIGLTDQDKQFITLYPNPFVNDVLIEYTLDAPDNVSAEVYSFNGNATKIALQPNTLQALGKHKYTLDGSMLKAGMYIVRVTVGKKVHSRILIKQ
jgi:hypothetical protein